MLAMLVGTAADTSFLADFMPSTLFPHDEVTVKHWAVAGISLGGHAVWHVLQNGEKSCFTEKPGLTLFLRPSLPLWCANHWLPIISRADEGAS